MGHRSVGAVAASTQPQLMPARESYGYTCVGDYADRLCRGRPLPRACSYMTGSSVDRTRLRYSRNDWDHAAASCFCIPANSAP